MGSSRRPWTGVDSVPTTPLDESVRDFVGHVLGEFYGPNAEEVGGVVTATRTGTADDRLLQGHIAGRRTDQNTGSTRSTGTPVYASTTGDTLDALLPDPSNQFAPQSAVIEQVYSSPRSALLSGDAYIKAISSDGAGGFHVTYVLGDDERSIHFEAADYGAGTSATQYRQGKRGWQQVLALVQHRRLQACGQE